MWWPTNYCLVITNRLGQSLIVSAKDVFETLISHDFRLADILIEAALNNLGEHSENNR